MVAKVAHHNRKIKHGEYCNPRPNAVWHLNGHHKLGPWGIVIHSISDGYDCLVSVSIFICSPCIQGKHTSRSPICESQPTTLQGQFCKFSWKLLQNGDAQTVHMETVVAKMSMSLHI